MKWAEARRAKIEAEKKQQEMRERQKVQMDLRQTATSMKSWGRKLERSKNEMLLLAQKAKQEGNSTQYKIAFSGLKAIMAQQKKASMMALNCEIIGNMLKATTLSADFVNTLGCVGTEVSRIVEQMNYAGNSMKLSEGLSAMENAMEQLDDFMEQISDSMEDGGMEAALGDEELDREIERMIDNLGAVSEKNADQDIEQEVQEKLRKMKLMQDE